MYARYCPGWNTNEHPALLLREDPLARPGERITDIGICDECLALVLAEIERLPPKYPALIYEPVRQKNEEI